MIVFCRVIRFFGIRHFMHQRIASRSDPQRDLYGRSTWHVLLRRINGNRTLPSAREGFHFGERFLRVRLRRLGGSHCLLRKRNARDEQQHDRKHTSKRFHIYSPAEFVELRLGYVLLYLTITLSSMSSFFFRKVQRNEERGLAGAKNTFRRMPGRITPDGRLLGSWP